MDKNTLVGLLLIILVLIGFTFLTRPSQEEIAAFYGANMRKYATQKDGKPFVPQLSDVSEKVKADILADAALRQAATAAEELAIAIYDSGAKMNSPEVRKIFSDAKVELKKSDVIRTTDKSAPKGIPENVAAAGLHDAYAFHSCFRRRMVCNVGSES